MAWALLIFKIVTQFETSIITSRTWSLALEIFCAGTARCPYMFVEFGLNAFLCLYGTYLSIKIPLRSNRNLKFDDFLAPLSEKLVLTATIFK